MEGFRAFLLGLLVLFGGWAPEFEVSGFWIEGVEEVGVQGVGYT